MQLLMEEVWSRLSLRECQPRPLCWFLPFILTGRSLRSSRSKPYKCKKKSFSKVSWLVVYFIRAFKSFMARQKTICRRRPSLILNITSQNQLKNLHKNQKYSKRFLLYSGENFTTMVAYNDVCKT